MSDASCQLSGVLNCLGLKAQDKDSKGKIKIQDQDRTVLRQDSISRFQITDNNNDIIIAIKFNNFVT